MFIIHFIRTAIRRQRAINHLRGLDDRLLRDAGIMRDDISDVVRGRIR